MHQTYYLLPDAWKLKDFESHIKQAFNLIDDTPQKLTQTFYDSFDWRVWQAGAELYHVQGGANNRLCWVDNTAQTTECINTDKVPVAPSDLPSGVIRDRLAGALTMRVLLPVIQIEQNQQVMKVLDDEEKTILRVILQKNHFRTPEGTQDGDLNEQVVVQPLKGYEEAFKSFQLELEKMGLQPVMGTLLSSALSQIGRRQGDYTTKLTHHLDPEMRSDATTKLILLGILSTLEKNIQGIKDNLDSEFLHDFRVAVRRSRSAMTQIKDVFNPEEIEKFKEAFSWLGQITGPARDMDVYLLKYPEYKQSLPAKIQPDLAPFHDFLEDHHRKSYQELVTKLNSAQFRKLMKSWREWLEKEVPNVAFQANSVRPIAELADQGIFKMYRRVLKDGRKIKGDTHPELLHELRKDCKKLRYLMEFFQSLYPKREIAELIQHLKILLDNLGDFQDLQVQAESIESFGVQMQQEGAPSKALMAMGILVGNLLQRQEQARKEFAGLFAAFDTPVNAAAFKQLFGPKS